jgi:hypothetical protein
LKEKFKKELFLREVMKTNKEKRKNAENISLLRRLSQYAAACMPVTGLLSFRFQNSQMAVQNGEYGIVPFPSAASRKLRYSCADSEKITGVELLYTGRVNGLDVIDVKKTVSEGKFVRVIGEGISDAFAKDFLDAGASVSLVEFNPSSNEIHKSISQGIGVYAVFEGYSSRLIDLKKCEEETVKELANRGSLEVYVAGNLSVAQVEDLRKNRIHIGLPFDYQLLKKAS